MWRSENESDDQIRLQDGSIVLPPRVFDGASGVIFGYPSRLASAWKPASLQWHVDLPAHRRDGLTLPIDENADSAAPDASTGLLRRMKGLPTSRERRDAIDVEGVYYDARFENASNVAHAIKNISPSAFAARKVGIEPLIVLNGGPENLLDRTLRALDYKVVRTAKRVRGDRIGAQNGRHGLFEPYYLDIFPQFPPSTESTSARLFIGRKTGRRIENELEVTDLLAEYGFRVVYFEEIDMHQQFQLVANAECVAALHGAAMAHLVFNHSRPKVIEIFHPGYVTHTYRNMTWSIGGTWAGVTGRLTPDVVKELDMRERPRAFADKSTRVDVGCVQAALEYLGITRNPEDRTSQ